MRRPHEWNRYPVFIFVFVWFLLPINFIFAGKGPRIEFKEENCHFRKAKQGDVLTHTFVFKNVGDETLEIKKVRTTCGCTAALVSDREVAPGETGEVKVTFNTKGYRGNLSKYIFVESNDPTEPNKRLTVSANIEVPPQPKVVLDRYNIETGLHLEVEEIRARTKIRNEGELELRVICAHTTGEAGFYSRGKEVSFPLKIPAGKEVELEIRIPPRKIVGQMREYIKIKSNDPFRSEFILPVYGYIVSKRQLKELYEKYKDIL